jgi:drug/metabolite transporter (DMT)-like permease
MGGNGLVMLAEGVRKVPSGITALMLGFTPVWMTLLGWLWIRTRRPGLRSIIGLCAGFAGLVLLVGPWHTVGAATTSAIDPLGAAALVGAGLSWSIGSLYSKRARMPKSPQIATAMEMLAGGVALLVAGSLRGEWAAANPSHFSLISTLSFLYLVVFGSLVGFSAYIYCLQHTAPALAATYAYVNPVVAVALGWAFAGEALTARTFIAAAVIIFGVIMISLEESSNSSRDKAAENPDVCEPAA